MTCTFSLGVAASITLLVVLFGFFAIFNLKPMSIDWRNTFIQFQTFFSALSVLAASLFAYHASTSGTKEVQRKNAEDQTILRHNILVKATLAVEMARAESNAMLHHLHQFSDGYTQKEIPIQMYKRLSITMPQQLLEVMNDLSSIPEDTYIPLSHLILYIQKYISTHHNSIDLCNEKIEIMKGFDVLFKEYIRLKHFNTQKEFEDEYRKLEISREKSTSIKWRLTGRILEDINRLTLDILKSLPLSKEWKIHDQVPYPSEFIRNEAG